MGCVSVFVSPLPPRAFEDSSVGAVPGTAPCPQQGKEVSGKAASLPLPNTPKSQDSHLLAIHIHADHKPLQEPPLQTKAAGQPAKHRIDPSQSLSV